jgi:2-oxo-3-hexenedioate decarboxylase
MNINELATTVDQAAFNASPISQLSLTNTFSEADAYAIQAASMGHRYARGEKLIGLKMGFTSEAKMKQMGVHDMIWGRLTDSMLIENGELKMENFIHPRAEPEICFLVNQDIDRELSLEEAPAYVETVAAAIEIIDSRYQNFKFSLEDVIADNCSSAALFVGAWQDKNTPLGDLKISLEIDGEVRHEGSSAAILGDPWRSFVAATRLAHQYGQPILSGSYIMAGAATPAVFLEVGQEVRVRVEGLGEVGFVVK